MASSSSETKGAEGAAATPTATMCNHSVWEWGSCARCGRPCCGTCVPPGVALEPLAVTIPLQLCSECATTLRAMAAHADVDDRVFCPEHAHGRATPTVKSSCKQCQAARVAARLRGSMLALELLSHERFFGEGERHTHAGRAALATAAAVPMAVCSGLVGGLLGAGSGLVGGVFGGALFGGAAGLDARNSAATSFSSVRSWSWGRRSKDATGNGAALSSSAAAGLGSPPGGAHPSASPHAAGADTRIDPSWDAAEGGPTSGNGAAAPTASALPAPGSSPVGGSDEPSAAASAVASAAKAVLRMSPEAKEANAAAELQRILACKTAYDILQLPRDASAADVKVVSRAKALAYHPDRNDASKAKEVSQAVNNAYSLLGDPAKRASYDRSDCQDTQGIDLLSGIKVTTSGVVSGAAGGIVGAALGGTVGLVAGLLGGAISGVASGVHRSREMATSVESAGATVGRLVAGRRAAISRSAAHALGALAAAGQGGGPAGGGEPSPSSGSGSTPTRPGPTGLEASLLSSASALELSFDYIGVVDPAPAGSGGALQDATPAAAISALAAVRSPAATPRAPAPAGPIAPWSMPDLATLEPDAAVSPAFTARVLAAVGQPDQPWLGRMMKDVGAAASAARRADGIPEPEAEAHPAGDGEGDGEGHGVSARDYDDVGAAAGGGLAGALGAKPPKSALGLISLLGTAATQAHADGADVAAVQAWGALSRVYECWSHGVEAPPEVAAAEAAAAARKTRAKGVAAAAASAKKHPADAAAAQHAASLRAAADAADAADAQALHTLARSALPTPPPPPAVEAAAFLPRVRVQLALPAQAVAGGAPAGRGVEVVDAALGSMSFPPRLSKSPASARGLLAPASVAEVTWVTVGDDAYPVHSASGNRLALPLAALRDALQRSGVALAGAGPVTLRLRVGDAPAAPALQEALTLAAAGGGRGAPAAPAVECEVVIPADLAHELLLSLPSHPL